jgi:hypothetical protein
VGWEEAGLAGEVSQVLEAVFNLSLLNEVEDVAEELGRTVALLSPYILNVYCSSRGFMELELSDDARPVFIEVSRMRSVTVVELG